MEAERNEYYEDWEMAAAELDEATARADRAEATVAICIHAYQTDNAIPQSVLADTPVSPVRVTVTRVVDGKPQPIDGNGAGLESIDDGEYLLVPTGKGK